MRYAPSMPLRSLSPFGQLLRFWRTTRKRSQLDLALEADVSARHLSFVETGRAQPSRQMVLLLADVLDVPLRDRNALLQAAGFVAAYRETDLDAPELAAVRKSIEFVLERHNPYPSVLVDRHWNLRLQNRTAARTLPLFLAGPVPPPPVNLMRLLFHADGARRFIVNWHELAAAMIHRLQRDATQAGSDGETRALLEELLGAEDVPADWRTPDFGADPPAFVPMRLERNGLELSFFSAITTLGTPQDITLSELRMETFFPADDRTDQALRALSATA